MQGVATFGGVVPGGELLQEVGWELLLEEVVQLAQVDPGAAVAVDELEPLGEEARVVAGQGRRRGGGAGLPAAPLPGAPRG